MTRPINVNALQKYRYCFVAGLCAAGGSFFGKLPSLLKDSDFYKTEVLFMNHAVQKYAGLPIGVMIICNLLNWRYFLKALQMSEQTLITTVLTSASNYVVSFILGAIIFQEPLSLLSLLGCSLIVLGLWFLCAENQSERHKTTHLHLN